jgi:hypothetical protein
MKKLLFLLLFAFVLTSCSGIKDAITNAERLQWKLGSVSGMSVSGVDVSKITSFSNINPLDIIKLTNVFSTGKLPASFTLNLLAKNPEGSGGSPNSSDMIRSLNWRLLIDNVETIAGDIPNPITIPGVGKTATIPLTMNVDLLQFFNNQGLQNLVGLVLGIGGANGSPSRLSLKIKPTVDTFLGPFTYPGEITVIDREFKGRN